MKTSEWHRPAVLEALGCLIPPELDASQDGKRAAGRRGGAGAEGEEPVGVFVRAGSWRVDVCEERALAAARLGKGTLEFFLRVLRRARSKLELPVALLSQEVAGMVGGDKDLESVMKAVRGYKHWGRLRSELESAEVLAMVACLRPEEGKFPRDCVAVFVENAEEGQPLQGAQGFRVIVFDVGVGRG